MSVDSSDDSSDDSSSDDQMDDENQEPAPYQGSKRWNRARKLEAVVNILRQEHWSFAQFLSAWVRADDAGDKGVTIKHRRYGRVGQRRRALLDAVAEDPQLSQLLGAPMESFTTELDRLIREPYFATFNRASKLEDLDFTVAFRTVQDVAPAWHAILMRMLGNQRAHRASYRSQKAGGQKAESQDALVRRAYAITSMICFSRAKKRSNFFPSLVDIYLIGSGVKRRVFETLSGFGLCHGYHSANRIMDSIAEEAEVCEIPLPANS